MQMKADFCVAPRMLNVTLDRIQPAGLGRAKAVGLFEAECGVAKASAILNRSVIARNEDEVDIGTLGCCVLRQTAEQDETDA